MNGNPPRLWAYTQIGAATAGDYGWISRSYGAKMLHLSNINIMLISNSYTYSIFLIAIDKISQNLFGGTHLGRPAHLYQRIGLLRWEVALVFVDVDAGFKPCGIGFGVELGGVDVLLIADHLKGACGGACEMGATCGQGLHGFFVADEGAKMVGEVAG